FFFFSSRRRHTRFSRDWSSDVCSSDLSYFPVIVYRSARMATIKQDDFIQSIADAFQFISYYHPEDFIRAMSAAYEREESPAAKEIGRASCRERVGDAVGAA